MLSKSTSNTAVDKNGAGQVLDDGGWGDILSPQRFVNCQFGGYAGSSLLFPQRQMARALKRRAPPLRIIAATSPN